MINTKQCSNCKEVKPVTEFYKDKKSKYGLRCSCKSCDRLQKKQYRKANKKKLTERNKQYYEANKERLLEYRKQYYEANKENIIEQIKQYYEANKERLLEQKKQYYETNKEDIIERNKQYYEANKEEIAERMKQYCETNKEKIKKYKRQYARERCASDPAYKLRCRVSSDVRRTLKSQGKQKGGSTFEHLPYTSEELKEHIESLWEPWMNWNNWGAASKERRTWQVDHIIPQSHLIYDSLQHPNFQKCWALSNLRPICSWENLKKSDKLLTEES